MLLDKTKEKLDRVEALKETGLTAKEACEKIGIATTHYYGWRARLKKQEGKPRLVRKKPKVIVYEGGGLKTPRRQPRLQLTPRLTLVVGSPEEVAAFYRAVGAAHE
jgi:transposase-like protein